MRQPFGSPPPGGRAHGYGCGRQPLAERGTAGGACAVGPAVTRPARGYRLRPRAGRRGDNAPERHLCPRITGAKGVNLRYA